MRALVLCADYPNTNGGKAMAYAHTRNTWLKEHGIDVTVLNFSARNNYTIDGVEVITLASFKSGAQQDFDIFIAHAANVRNHLRFFRQLNDQKTPRLFFFHGHEVLRLNEAYPEKYEYQGKKSNIGHLLQDIYDSVKLRLWRNYFTKDGASDSLVFVSGWMMEEFFANTGLDKRALVDRCSVIPNVVAAPFLEDRYDGDGEKEFDFITIRGNLDVSKYGIDLVCDIAEHLPNRKFLIVGKGRFFDHFNKPSNVVWLDSSLSHQEMTKCLDRARCALMPTRLDAQGVAMCEMATYGIPLLTTDLPICREMLGDFPNVGFFSLESPDYLAIDEWTSALAASSNKNLKFSAENTVAKEKELIEGVVNSGR